MPQQDDVPDTEDQQLSEDNDPPFSDPDDMKSNIPPDEPQTDTGIEASERYEEGLAGAAEVDDGTKRHPENGEIVG